MKNKSPLKANRSPVPSRNANVLLSGPSNLSYVCKSSQLKTTTEYPLENRKKSTYVSLIDKIESERQMKSKLKGRHDNDAFSKLTNNFNNVSPSVVLRQQESLKQHISRNDPGLREDTSSKNQSNASYLRMYS